MAMALLGPPCACTGASNGSSIGSSSMAGTAQLLRGTQFYIKLDQSIGAPGCSRSRSAHMSWKCAVEQAGGENSVAREEISGRGTSVVAAEEVDNSQLDGRVVAGTDLGSILEWELDFCSRPIFDDRGKRLWELVVCDGKRQLEFARFYPNNVINSVTLKNALAEIIKTFGLPKPIKVRFFRSQMQTIISKACSELDIQAVPSQRCITLIRWLQERYEQVYRHDPGFQENASPLFVPDPKFPSPVPQNLRGDRWAFVQLPFQALQEEMKLVEKGSTFGNVSIDAELPSPDTLIPGVAVASKRAVPLAAWTNSQELASLEVDKQNSSLVLSSGVSQRWLYASYRKSQQADEEADAWEVAKKASGGLHFLAIQPSLDSDSCSGLWLLYDVPSSPV